MKKALNAILFIAAAWALNTGTHSFREAEGGGTLAKWIHLCEPVNTNSSIKKWWKFPETNRKSSIFRNESLRRSILTLLVYNLGHIYLASMREEALSSASSDSTSGSLLNHFSKCLQLNTNLPSPPSAEHLMPPCWLRFHAILKKIEKEKKTCPFSGPVLNILWSSAARWGMVGLV